MFIKLKSAFSNDYIYVNAKAIAYIMPSNSEGDCRTLIVFTGDHVEHLVTESANEIIAIVNSFKDI